MAPPPLRTVIPAPLPPEPVPAPVVASTPLPPPTAEDPGKFKLKPRGATPVAPAPAAAPATPPAAVPAPQPVGPVVAKPTLPAAALASVAFTPPAAPVLPGRPNMPIAPLPPSAPVAMPIGGQGPRPQGKMVSQNAGETEAARGKFALKLLMALLFVAFVLGGIFAYNLWFTEDPAPAPVVAKPVPAPQPADAPLAASSPETASAAADANAAPTPTPATVVVDNPQSALGQQVAKAQAAVAAHDAALTQPVDDLLKPSATPTAPADQPATAASAAPTPVETAPAVTPPPPPAPEPVRPEPSAAFKSFVVNLKVNGVFQGENARAMINGKMYRLGEVVDSKLGIVFVRLEPEDKRIVFEDGKGAIMSRRY
jgi:hypothetical protein